MLTSVTIEQSSPSLSSQSMLPISSPLTQLPDAVFSFFKDVPTDGYPEGEALVSKIQPWRRVWQGPKPSPDGSVMIAVPKKADFGGCILYSKAEHTY